MALSYSSLQSEREGGESGTEVGLDRDLSGALRYPPFEQLAPQPRPQGAFPWLWGRGYWHQFFTVTS